MIIKVCGMREDENIRRVEALSTDWMGFIFYPPSPRFVASVPHYLPAKAHRVGVFVNASTDELLAAVNAFRLDILQLHGDETPARCAELKERFRLPLVKAFGLREDFRFDSLQPYAAACDYFLFDTPAEGRGGSGRSFNWPLLTGYTGDTPFLLSGGIGPDSLPALQAFHHPRWAGIDLNSRFETAPAHKDTAKLQAFLTHIRQTHTF